MTHHPPPPAPEAPQAPEELTDFLLDVMCNHYGQLGPEQLRERA